MLAALTAIAREPSCRIDAAFINALRRWNNSVHAIHLDISFFADDPKKTLIPRQEHQRASRFSMIASPKVSERDQKIQRGFAYK